MIQGIIFGVLSLLLLFGQVQGQNEASMPLYQVHGSGTSNPAPLVWRVMDIMMARTKPRVAMSYRSVGSGTGGDEFRAGASAFGCGDVPISVDNFNTLVNKSMPMIHVPFLIGSVSIFHNLPGVGEGMYLAPCTLAKIFRGAITRWNDDAITSTNPHLPELATADETIRIVHRNPGSSSTYALTHYLNKTCPEEWSLVKAADGSLADTGPRPGDARRVGVTTDWPADNGIFFTVENSQGMVETIANNAYSIGYVESGQGLQAGLKEIKLKNVNGKELVSSDASIASNEFISNLFPADLGASSWTTVNPVYAASRDENQWPLTLGTYLYVSKDLTFLNQTAGLLKLFVQMLLSDEVALMMKDYSFMALPDTYRRSLNAAVASNLTIPDNSTAGYLNWIVEGSTLSGIGQQNYVVSRRRDSYLVSTVTGLVTDNIDAKRTLMLGDAYQVHGSGSFVPATMIRHAQQVLTGRARVPVSLTYRAVGSVLAQQEFADYRNMFRSYNHFKVADMPLSPTYRDTLTTSPAVSTTGAVLQVPLGVSSLGIYYNKAVPGASLVLNCTLLARLYGGSLTSWGDAGLAELNGFNGTAARTLLDPYNVTVYGMADPAGPTWALTGYLSAACPGVWTATTSASPNVTWPAAVTTTYQGASISSPDDMLEAILGTPNSIGYLPALLGATSGLAEARLPVEVAGVVRPVTCMETNLTIVAEKLASLVTNCTADLNAVVGSAIFNLNGTWPIPIVPYLFMYRNLTSYGYSGPLLRAFVDFLLSNESIPLAVECGLEPLPYGFRRTLSKEVSLAKLKTLTVVWDQEAAGVSDADVGAGLYTFSANRQSYDAVTIQRIQDTLSAVQGQLTAALPAVARVTCTPAGLPYMRLLRGDVEAMAASPVRIWDDMSSSVEEAEAALVSGLAPGGSAAAGTRTLLVLSPGPLRQATWQALSKAVPMVQVPASVRPVALVYRGPGGLRLGPCALAKIFGSQQPINWNDQSAQADNPGLTLPGRPIRLLTQGAADADLRSVLAYIARAASAAGCSTDLQLGNASSAGSDIRSQVAEGLEFDALGVVPATSLTSGGGLQAVALPSTVSGKFLTPLERVGSCPSTGCAGAAAAAYSAALDEVLAGSSPGALGIPDRPTGDWSNFTTQPAGGAKLTRNDVYPIFRLDFLVFPADLPSYGEDGVLALAAVQYGTSAAMASRVNEALGPYYAGLDQKALSDLVQPALDLSSVLAPQEATRWDIVKSPVEQAEASDPKYTLTLSRAPSTSASALAGTDAQQSSATDVSDILSDLQAQIRDAQDKADLAYDIAVAAIVLGLILSLLALALAAHAVLTLRRFGANLASPSSCLNPIAAAKYEPQIDVHGGGPNIEMQMQQAQRQQQQI